MSQLKTCTVQKKNHKMGRKETKDCCKLEIDCSKLIDNKSLEKVKN